MNNTQMNNTQMNNTKMNNNNLPQLIKKIKLANEEADKCGFSKCSDKHPNIKYILDSQKECKKKFEHYPIDRKMEQMADENKCLEDKKIDLNERMSLARCVTKECHKNIDKVILLGQDLVYLTHPNGKELKMLTEKEKQLGLDENECSDKNCGHIYLNKNLIRDRKTCQKLAKDMDFTKQFECLDKKKIPEKIHSLFECKKKSCGKIMKERKMVLDKRFKLIAPNMMSKMKNKIVSNLPKSSIKQKTKKQK